MKAIVSSAVLIAALSVLSGCSNDPTSEDFKEFAERYAKQAGGEIKGVDGSTTFVTCRVIDHDLRKTDSLTTPYVGTFKMDTDMANLFVYSSLFAGGKTEAIYHNRIELVFAWNGTKWVPKSGSKYISGVTLPKIPKTEYPKYGSFHNTLTSPVTPEQIQSLNIFAVNGFIDPE